MGVSLDVRRVAGAGKRGTRRTRGTARKMGTGVQEWGAMQGREGKEGKGNGNAPDADKVDVDIDRERFLERRALRPADLVRARVHLVRERDLFWVISG